MNILVVDDIAMNRKLLRLNLEAEGDSVVEAADGVEALAVLENGNISAIISDILMPRMDGYRLCYEVRRSERFRKLPFVIYTSTYTSPADEKLAANVGADKYLTKPAPMETIRAALNEFAAEPRYQASRPSALTDEQHVMKEYSEALVRKLEEKNAELEKAQAELRQLNAVLEARVKARTAELEAANIELAAFNQSVAHDLRNPLTMVLGFTQFLVDTEHTLGEEERRYPRMILGSAERMSALLEDLMKLSRIKEGELAREPYDMSAQVQSVLEEIQQRDAGRKVTFKVAPGITGYADERLVRIVLENLLGNAWKFTAKSAGPAIEFGECEHNGATAYFVRDNGAGFDMARAGKLFHPFQRLHANADFRGTGIGLTIVRRVIAKHGGAIHAEAAPGKGATFYFTLSP